MSRTDAGMLRTEYEGGAVNGCALKSCGCMNKEKLENDLERQTRKEKRERERENLEEVGSHLTVDVF